MAFAPLRAARRGPFNSSVITEITVSVLGKKARSTGQAYVSVPRSILRECGLPDYPGAHLDLMIGNGADRGSIALIKGSRLKVGQVGTGPHRVFVRTALLSTTRYATKVCAYEAGNNQLIIHLPADFPIASDAAASPAATAHAATSINEVAA